MKIIFFNIWHGKVWKGLKEFILEQSKNTDIFCFLEVDPVLQEKLLKTLPSFNFFYSKGVKTGYWGGIYEGRSVFVKKNADLVKCKRIKLFNTHKFDAGGMIFSELKIKDKTLFLGCVHGKTKPGTKFDTSLRLKQSEIIIDAFKNLNGPKIIGGDFNLNPDTKSIEMIEKAGYVNLIKEFKIKTTRNKISWEEFRDYPGFVKQYFADYVFISPGIKVKKFEVPYKEISDHLPLILEFDL